MLKFGKTIISEKEIQSRVSEVGRIISNDYKDKQDDGIVVVGVLKGAVLFTADLIRSLDLKIEIDFISASSYNNSLESSGNVKIEKWLSTSAKGKHIIVVEDVVDSGLTLKCITEKLKDEGAASVKICALLDKHLSKSNIEVSYMCFDCPNEFIVGYGLDYKQNYRNIPYITSLVEE